MSDKATPRPWVKSRYLGGACAIDNVNGCGDRLRHIADVFDPEDAALVLAAVNAYEAHQRAAEALRAMIDNSLCAVPHSDDGGGRCGGCRAVREARAALAELDKVTR